MKAEQLLKREYFFVFFLLVSSVLGFGYIGHKLLQRTTAFVVGNVTEGTVLAIEKTTGRDWGDFRRGSPRVMVIAMPNGEVFEEYGIFGFLTVYRQGESVKVMEHGNQFYLVYPAYFTQFIGLLFLLLAFALECLYQLSKNPGFERTNSAFEKDLA